MPRAREDQRRSLDNQAGRGRTLPSPPFVLLGPSTGWMKPPHTGGGQSSSPTPLIQTRISSGNSLTDTPRKNKVSSNIWASRDPVKLIQMINHRGIPRARGRTSGQVWALAAAVGAARRRVKEGQAPPSNSESVHKVSRCHKHHAHALIVRWPTQRPPWRSPAVPESNCFYHCCNNIMIAFITSVIEAILVDLNGC